jgi:hypothetical protein
MDEKPLCPLSENRGEGVLDISGGSDADALQCEL